MTAPEQDGSVSFPYAKTTCTIASSGQNSTAVCVVGKTSGTVYTPGTVTGTTLTVQKSPDGGTTWYTTMDEAGTAFTIPSSGTLTDGNAYSLDPKVFEGASHIRLRSSTTEGQATVFTVGLS